MSFDDIPSFPSSDDIASAARKPEDSEASIDKDSPTHLHTQLADFLREKIYSHEWGPRKRIPSEHDLMGRFKLSRGTVRRAIKSLVDEGLLSQEHGRGTFVAEPGISHPAGVRPLSFAESLRAQGADFVTHVIDKFVVPAPSDVARELELEPGDDVLFIRRIRTVDDEPVICQEGWFSLSECPGLDEVDFTRESAFDAAQRCAGRPIVYSRIRYTARVAGKEHGAYLGCEESAPVLMLEQTIRLADDRPIEWNHTWLKAGQSVVGDAVQPH